ncbi:hypothetical protein F2Q69_00034387 [Brassica cretica]|uniref:Uncharacterized protein n=1 Tax=Brassica cretica TaxID=69181 RepID=A0A8S9SQG1_BRACR|nr:hypothetical protein F2Q69_00034387 [Brassica cretica]
MGLSLPSELECQTLKRGSHPQYLHTGVAAPRLSLWKSDPWRTGGVKFPFAMKSQNAFDGENFFATATPFGSFAIS